MARGRHGFTEKTGFWVEEMKWLPAEHGDQSIKDQAQTVCVGGGEEERDTLISVEPALTLMVASRGPDASSRDLFQLDSFFSPPLLQEKEKKSILGSPA